MPAAALVWPTKDLKEVTPILLGRAEPKSLTAVAIGPFLEKLPADRFTGAQDFAKAMGDPGFRHGELAVVGVVAGRSAWSPFQVVVVDGKTQGVDQVKRGPGGGTQPGDVAGVRGNLRVYENDLEAFHGRVPPAREVVLASRIR